ncbi:hypothetical protein M413DRAFT_438785 [Hebeloma cylindrosporum]|uniref:Uncharacterized protein n=1 Tax=Hebeloma cylindrosporum TaxID=76867 RepID=A0A0C2YIP3_HEBCY|nr:hypothetical protein M413DRAFT_438785 [Hebeloma cylindrosporum h7]
MPSGSPAPSSSSSRSSPEPQIRDNKSNSKKEKSKAKSTAARNEGTDPTWDYAPPPDAVLVNDNVDAGEFDWDTIHDNDDLELWLIRVPESVKPKHLEGISIDIPSSSKSARIGTIQRKRTTFDIWSVGDDQTHLVGGEELKSLSCLLPRKSKKGKLYPSPKPISHRLVVAAQAVTPTPDSSLTDADPTTQYKNPPRHSYPKEVLKHRFTPYGTLLNPVQDDSMDIDDAPVQEPQPPPSPTKKQPKTTDAVISDPPTEESKAEREVKSTKGKKRKGETADPPDVPAKKPKKTKSH